MLANEAIDTSKTTHQGNSDAPTHIHVQEFDAVRTRVIDRTAIKALCDPSQDAGDLAFHFNLLLCTTSQFTIDHPRTCLNTSGTWSSSAPSSFALPPSTAFSSSPSQA